MKFVYDLNESEVAAVQKSLNAYNNAKPDKIENPDYVEAQGLPTLPDPNDENGELPNPDYKEAIGESHISNPDLIGSVEDYLTFVFSECFKSYQKQFESDDS